MTASKCEYETRLVMPLDTAKGKLAKEVRAGLVGWSKLPDGNLQVSLHCGYLRVRDDLCRGSCLLHGLKAKGFDVSLGDCLIPLREEE